MSHKHLHVLIGALAVMLTTFATTPVIAQQAGAILDSATPAGPGRCNIRGRALAANGQLACALALASGRCMFTCGPGSLRCEGGTDPTIPFGHFELFNLPLEADGNIYLQIFVQGSISFTGRIPGSACGGVPPVETLWRAYNNTCCNNGRDLVTYEVTVDGVTRRSISNSCTAPSTNEGFVSTIPGTKQWTARVFSACGNRSAQGTVTMARDTCYRFRLVSQNNDFFQEFTSIPCSSTVNTLQEDADATPMAIFPTQPDGDDSGSQGLVPSQKINPQP